MSLDRRRFILGAGLALAGGAVAAERLAHNADGTTTARPAPPEPGPARQDDREAVRAEFNLTREYLHFGGLYIASHPAPVRDAIERHRRAMDENPVVYLQEQGGRLEANVRRAAAEYLRVQPAEIALTDSTTMGLGILYNGIDLRAGQEALTTQHDFYATHEALRLKAARTGATVQTVPLYGQVQTATEDEIVESIRRAVTPRTRVVAVTWVHSSTGLKIPVRRIADALAELNAGRGEAERALLCVDGVHGLGVEDVTVADLGCDFFVAGCHKWLFGPRGTGLIWGHPRAWPAVSATIPSFTGDGTPGGEVTPGGFHSFEHRWALAQAFSFHLLLGKDRVAERIHALNRQLKEGLAQMSHVTLFTPMTEDLSAGLVCFNIRGMNPRMVVQRLRDRKIVATTTPYSPSYARLAPGLLNSPDEVEQVLREVRALA